MVRQESFFALQSELTDLELILRGIKDVITKTPSLAKAASLSVRLRSLKSTFIMLREVLGDSQNLVQVKGNRTNLSRSPSAGKDHEVRMV